MNHLAASSSANASARILVLGLGETGAAAACWLARAGQSLRIADTREAPPGLEALRAALVGADVEYHLGQGLPSTLLAGVTQLVLSPGLAPNVAPVSDLLAQAAVNGVEVVGEIELFARALAQLKEERGYAPRVLAVTGTNGKTTVTSLTRHLLEAAGVSARAAGNISPAALAALADALDSDSLPQAWVLELSSFQLETTRSLQADAATVLNVTQDHLDWHGGMDAYAAAKARLFDQAALRIVNRDDAMVVGMVAGLDRTEVRSFGRGEPSLAGDMGLVAAQDIAWLAASESAVFDEPVAAPARRSKGPQPAPVREPGRETRLMPVDALRLRGLHNALNVQAALLLARSLGLPWAPLLRAAGLYEGEPHRMTFVRSIGGVDFINDSKGTNVGATVAGLDGLSQPVVLIAGGQGKGQDFTELAQLVARRARAVVLIGQDASILAQALAQQGVDSLRCGSMDEAVRAAYAQAQSGDVVLLSPACASLDMFKGYPQRGQAFAEAVRELALDNGEVA